MSLYINIIKIKVSIVTNDVSLLIELTCDQGCFSLHLFTYMYYIVCHV